MASRIKKRTDVKGNHLTVLANGEMIWDWDALLKEVEEATKLIPVTEAKVKKTRAKKIDTVIEDKPKRTKKSKK